MYHLTLQCLTHETMPSQMLTGPLGKPNVDGHNRTRLETRARYIKKKHTEGQPANRSINHARPGQPFANPSVLTTWFTSNSRVFSKNTMDTIVHWYLHIPGIRWCRILPTVGNPHFSPTNTKHRSGFSPIEPPPGVHQLRRGLEDLLAVLACFTNTLVLLSCG